MITLFGNEEKPKPGLLDRLKESVSKTRSQLSARVEELFTGTKKIDPAAARQARDGTARRRYRRAHHA